MALKIIEVPPAVSVYKASCTHQLCSILPIRGEIGPSCSSWMQQYSLMRILAVIARGSYVCEGPTPTYEKEDDKSVHVCI